MLQFQLAPIAILLFSKTLPHFRSVLDDTVSTDNKNEIDSKKINMYSSSYSMEHNKIVHHISTSDVAV